MTPTLLPPRRRLREPAARRRALALGGTAVAAAAGFGALAAATARRATAEADEEVRTRTGLPRRHPARRAADALAPAGKWWAYVPAAVAVALYVLASPRPARDAPRGLARLRRPRRPAARRGGAGAVALTSVLAAALAPAFDRWLPQPPAPPGHASRRKPVFPSGHAFGPTAVALASAYVLTREGLARPAVAVPAALLYPLASAGGKLAEEKHWGSDVLGGGLAGVAVAAACLAAYELATAR